MNTNRAIAFRTLHGSRLYGLAHANSDTDMYTVLMSSGTGGRSRNTHQVNGDDDQAKVSMGSFLAQCEKGVPQALEAMFSRIAEPSMFDAFRAGYRADTAKMATTYRRTIRNMAAHEDFKRRRHAVRLILNLNEALTTGKGRFNPTLTEAQKQTASDAAALPTRDYLLTLRGLSIIELDWLDEMLAE